MCPNNPLRSTVLEVTLDHSPHGCRGAAAGRDEGCRIVGVVDVEEGVVAR